MSDLRPRRDRSFALAPMLAVGFSPLSGLPSVPVVPWVKIVAGLVVTAIAMVVLVRRLRRSA